MVRKEREESENLDKQQEKKISIVLEKVLST
jgi:hypothetical protein